MTATFSTPFKMTTQHLSSVDEARIRDLYQVKLNQVKMVQQRGYDLGRDAQIIGDDKTFQDFLQDYEFYDKYNGNVSAFRESLSIIYEHPETKETLFVHYFPYIPSVGMDQISVFSSLVDVHKANYNILILHVAMSDPAKKKFDDWGHTIQFFLDKELLFNLFTHSLYTPHVLIQRKFPPKDFPEKMFAIDLSRIKFSDPVVKRLGGIPGDLVKITRREVHFPTMVRIYDVYRRVI